MGSRGSGWDALTETQREAVAHVDGPLLVLAGPGSGKTRVVTYRIANLIHEGISPSSILAVTFTNKAADEMKSRLQELVPGNWVWVGTFHRFCSRLLRRYAHLVGLESNFTIYDADDARRNLRLTIEQLNKPLGMTTPDRIAHHISWLKNRLISPEEYTPRPGHEMGPILKDIYPAYQRRLIRSNAVDFDDLLLYTAKLLHNSDELRASLDSLHRYVLVDEYQDTNMAQYAIVRALSVDHPNLSVTGDPDQSIYGWRGADINNILDFEKDFPGARIVRLEANYRSTPNILRVADALIANNARRKKKSLIPTRDEGLPVRLAKYFSGKEEADAITHRIQKLVAEGSVRRSDCAILYRANWLSRSIEYAFRAAGIPYQIVSGTEFYQRAEIKDLLAYLHAIHNPRDDVSLLRIINVPPRRIGKSSITRLADAASQHGCTLLEAARMDGCLASLSKAARQSLEAFANAMDRWAGLEWNSVGDLLQSILHDTGYAAMLENSDAPEDQDRLENLQELIAAAREFDARHDRHDNPDVLGAFLEHVALVNDVDGWNEQVDRVTLMTLHAAKGLEFKVVFLPAIEQGILPHERSMNDPEQLEEERRLLFVGMTRAREELHLTYASARSQRGGLRTTIPSMFLVELPRHDMELFGFSSSEFGGPSYDSNGFHDESDHHHIDEIYDDETSDDFRDPTPPPVRKPTATINTPPAAKRSLSISTGAQMWQQDHVRQDQQPAMVTQHDKLDPDQLQAGMTVIHPEYGPGKIVDVHGAGTRRTGTVNFVTAGPKRFVFAKSPLRPA